MTQQNPNKIDNLLIELFVEELPPKVLNQLGESFAKLLIEQLKIIGLTTSNSVVNAFATPRRLAALISHVQAVAADSNIEHKLMPAQVGLDASGQATPALIKKMLALGAFSAHLSADDLKNSPEFADVFARLKRINDGKADVLFLDITQKGATLAQGLQKALNETISKLPIPKVMRYQLHSNCALPGWTSVDFVRPAHGLIALHGNEIVPVSVLGLNAGNTTKGHRFEASVSSIEIENACDYEETLLKKGAVIADFAKRRAEIENQLNLAAALVGQGVYATKDEALLDEVTALVELPRVLTCQFEAEFLSVPQECLILTMKANQKYFPLLNAQGQLINQFLLVSNIDPKDPSLVIDGNERVVRPRLADAQFFFQQDRKKTLLSRIDQLKKVVYHNKLGSQFERMLRVQAIAKEIAKTLASQLGNSSLVDQVSSAAQLAKADLLTDMVGEFPELQGTMGRYYALNDGLSIEIADAIGDHYKPRFSGDHLPRNAIGLILALADKLETLVGMFGIGNLPTGEKDPFALRRHALGVIRILIEARLSLSIKELTRMSFAAFESHLFANAKNPKDAVQDSQTQAQNALHDFLDERLKSYLKDLDYTSHEIDAAMNAQQSNEWFSLPKRLAAVRAFNALPEAAALASANKRIGNILKKSKETPAAQIDESLLKEAQEKTLFNVMQTVLPKANAQFESGDYTANLQTLAALRDSVDSFFDSVMVNTDIENLRLNRLSLLKTLHLAMNQVADLGRLAS